MSTHQPGTGPVPQPPDRSQDDTERLDPLPDPDAATERLDATRPAEPVEPVEPVEPTQRLDLPAADVHDGSTPVAAPPAPEPSPEPSPVVPEPAPAPAAEAPSTTPDARPRTGRRAIRVGTVVWGLVVAVCGVLALAVAGGANVDGGTVAIFVLAGAGVALVAGSIVTGVRRRDRG